MDRYVSNILHYLPANALFSFHEPTDCSHTIARLPQRYDGEQYSGAVRSFELMTERAAVRASTALRQRMHMYYRRACSLEWMLREAALECDAWP